MATHSTGSISTATGTTANTTTITAAVPRQRTPSPSVPKAPAAPAATPPAPSTCPDIPAAGLAGPAADPHAHGVLACLAAPGNLPGLPDPAVLLGLLGTWHQRRNLVGFPDLMTDRR
ncbi:hypothetical protein [Streptomyces sp. NPDC089919]|uniref:hypothetical protein n=1 Tax=Streptomyces sp. NPDC089919 TaxID=3155188 RepID=UPI003428E356